MACDCEKKKDKCPVDFTKNVIEINNPEQLVLLRKVVMPASLPEAENPPVIGRYRNVILKYEDTGNVYIYSSDGIPTAIEANVPQEILDRITDLEEEDTVLHNEITTVSADLGTETLARENADTALSTAISAETSARTAADTAIRNDLTALTGRVTTAEGNIDTIEGKIPAQATAQNQLADKNFVNSSIATNTANFIGTFNSVAELEAYTGTVTNNDYAFVIVTDTQGNTAYDRYKYNGNTNQWIFEYELNNSSFTAEQWAAINSGITSGNVTKLAGLANIKSIGSNLNLDANGQLSGNYTHFTGATSSTDGVQGLVPAPLAGDQDKYLKADGTWGAVQAGPTVVQTTGTSTTDVMSQNATTSMVFADPGSKNKVQIGANAQAQFNNTVSIGAGANSSSNRCVAVGAYSGAAQPYSVALGFGSTANAQGEVGIGLSSSYAGNGYNSSNYRLLTGLYDPQNAHDAATKGYVDTSLADKLDDSTTFWGQTAANGVVSGTIDFGDGATIETYAAGGTDVDLLLSRTDGTYTSAIDIGSRSIHIGTSDTSTISFSTSSGGTISAGGAKITGVGSPTSRGDAATKGYVDDVAPVITMTTTDPGEGATLAENHFIGVYQ